MPKIEESGDKRDQKHAKLRRYSTMTSLMSRAFSMFVIVLALLSFVIVGAIWDISSIGTRVEASSKALSAPLTLIDEVEHLPAPSWKAIPMSLPYDGIVSVDVRVLRGNFVDVFLTTPDQVERIKRGDWSNLKTPGDVRAIKTGSYRHSGRLAKGDYYLVVSDMYIRLASASPSDVSARVELTR
jgi:hypothetical protein